MSNQLLPTNAVEIIGARTFTTSLMVADVFGKRHDHVLRDIEDLKTDCPDDFHLPNFGEMFRDELIGNGAVRKFRYFEITKDGFTLLAMGYTGAKAMQFKIAYINRFNEMEAALRQPARQSSRDTDLFARAGTDISAHRVRCYLALKTSGQWMTNAALAHAAKVSARTARQYTKLFCDERIVDRLRLSPGHQFRIADGHGQRNERFVREIETAADVLGIQRNPTRLTLAKG